MMRYIVPNDDCAQIIPLGHVGENNYTELAFDISAWQAEYAIGTVILLMQGPGDTTAYPAAVTIDGQYAVHVLTTADLRRAGNGKCQLQMASGLVIAKTKIFSTFCGGSIGDGTEPGPTPWPEVIWGQQNNKGAYLPVDLEGETDLSESTVLIGGYAFPLGMIDDKEASDGYANLILFPSIKNITIASAPAGSTSYTITGSAWRDIYGGDSSLLGKFKYCDGNNTGDIPAAYPTAVTINDDETITLTFAETLNPDAATDHLAFGITLANTSRGVIAVGNGIYNSGFSSLVMGAGVSNTSQNSVVFGQNVENTGNDSLVAGVRNRNTAARSIVAGSRNKNTQTDAAIFGRGHNSTSAPAGVAATGNYSELGATTLFAVGNGTDEDNRSNALEVTTDGEIKESGIKLKDKYSAKLYQHMINFSNFHCSCTIVNNSATAFTESTFKAYLSAAGLTSNTKYLPCTGLHIVANTLTTIMTGIYLDGSTIKANGVNVADGSTTASTFLIVVIHDTVVEI